MKSVCEERLSLVNSANAESGPADTLASDTNTSISQTADEELSKTDVQTDNITRKYYEVSFHQSAELLYSKEKSVYVMLLIKNTKGISKSSMPMGQI